MASCRWFLPPCVRAILHVVTDLHLSVIPYALSWCLAVVLPTPAMVYGQFTCPNSSFECVVHHAVPVFGMLGHKQLNDAISQPSLPSVACSVGSVSAASSHSRSGDCEKSSAGTPQPPALPSGHL